MFAEIEEAILSANGGLEYSIYLGHEDGTPFNPEKADIGSQLGGMKKLRNLFIEQSPLAAQTLSNEAGTKIVPVPIATCTREVRGSQGNKKQPYEALSRKLIYTCSTNTSLFTIVHA
ncbi:hypothetical protein TL16_g00103 [Triparma laevis f. inornata]|uniref:Uncharacterized protein n=1 Tax=Triparma laevis f. inornata TaxID=1714386 RepID=A0A9W6ZCG6_9STRA|nr:hypothetical protein TL16_g00103 [Triparma laevis f. inornata]